jgi:hypothetical protein
MAGAISEPTAFAETVVFLDHFKDLPDPRQAGKVRYPLPEILLLCLLAVLAGAETFVDIARFGEKFGAFSVKQRPARTGRNPRTGTHVAVDEKCVPCFKTGKEMRERLNRYDGGGAAVAEPQ